MNAEPEVIQVLQESTIEGNILKLNSGQLDRKLYVKVDKILNYLGGKWNRKLGGHVFDSDPNERLKCVYDEGKVSPPDKFGYFPTPRNVTLRMIKIARLEPGLTVLEPSAGQGAIADILGGFGCYLTLIEILPENRQILQSKGYRVDAEDFLQYNEKKFDRIIMNPPFEKQADIDHVLHAFELLNQSRILVSVMSAGVGFRDNKKTTAFRELVEKYGMFEQLPEDSFKESGTRVNTVLVMLRKEL